MMWRNQHKIVFISLFLISAIFLLTCGAHAQAGEKVAVFVSIPLASDWSGNLREVAASFKTALR